MRDGHKPIRDGTSQVQEMIDMSRVRRRTIGVIGGMSPESTADFYLRLVHRYHTSVGDHDYPRMVMLSVAFQPFIDAAYRCPGALVDAIGRVAAAGAEFAVVPCNSAHILHRQVSARLAIPWISLIETVADAVAAAGVRAAGVLGTQYTLRAALYQEALERRGIRAVVPTESQLGKVNRVIYDELIQGLVVPESKRFVVDVCREMAGRGAEGMILGCTELPSLLTAADVRMKVFDSIAIYVDRALAHALRAEMPDPTCLVGTDLSDNGRE
jgi:aspartate racemase